MDLEPIHFKHPSIHYPPILTTPFFNPHTINFDPGTLFASIGFSFFVWVWSYTGKFWYTQDIVGHRIANGISIPNDLDTYLPLGMPFLDTEPHPIQEWYIRIPLPEELWEINLHPGDEISNLLGEFPAVPNPQLLPYRFVMRYEHPQTLVYPAARLRDFLGALEVPEET